MLLHHFHMFLHHIIHHFTFYMKICFPPQQKKALRKHEEIYTMGGGRLNLWHIICEFLQPERTDIFKIRVYHPQEIKQVITILPDASVHAGVALWFLRM